MWQNSRWLRRWIMVIVGASWVLVADVAQAQTPHPCDIAAPTSGTAITGTSITISFCDDPHDVNGNADTPLSFALYDNSVRTTPTFTAVVPGSPVSGKVQYTFTTTAPATAGVHTFQVAVIGSTGGESAKSSPFVLTATLPRTVHTAPTSLSVK